MPGYGIREASEGMGLFPWSWATERLEKARNYWLSTTRPDGRPHTMPVWGVWLDDMLWFSTGAESRKARNLAGNPACVVAVEQGDGAVILEGAAEKLPNRAPRKRFAAVYGRKYDWDMEGFEEPIYVVRPAVVFGLSSAGEEFVESATRWVFPKGRAG